MSSLGFQRIYRALMEHSDTMCERAFLPDDAQPGRKTETPVTYESLTPLSSFSIIAVSVAYELELSGLVQMLDSAGIPIFREERNESHPFLLGGGPLTFSNPIPMSPFFDAICMGEAEHITAQVCQIIAGAPTKQQALEQLAKIESVYIPSIHQNRLPTMGKVDDSLLPAYAAIRTPHTELSNMFLIESERGCSRGCAYCVMRRSTNGGMRIVPKERLLELIPEDAPKVGLVGAAVSDHPKIVEIVHALADRGKSVGLSSLRPDRLSDEFVGALKRGGYRTLTTAMDGPSEKLRQAMMRNAREKNLVNAAERARKFGMNLKLYLMIGLPDETDDDIDECVKFTAELSKIVPIALGIAPFCSKRNTPLDGLPFAGIDVVDKRLDRLRRGLKGRADVRATSARWAWVEYVLSQGGADEGRALAAATRAGGAFAAYKKAFLQLESPHIHGRIPAKPACVIAQSTDELDENSAQATARNDGKKALPVVRSEPATAS